MSQASVSFTTRSGKQVEITREQTLEGMRKFDETADEETLRTGTKFYVENDGKRYPPKWVISLATGVQRNEFFGGLQGATKYLSDLGFETGVVEHRAGDPPSTDVPEDVEDPNAFVLEKYLEDFIVSNFQTIFKGELKIYEDKEGKVGQQFQAPDIHGRIDILATEPKTNSFVVIELKKGRPSDQVLGQVQRYMGWVKKTLCVDGQGVKGLIIGRNPDPKLTYGLEVTQNINVRYYKISFELTEPS